MLSRTNQINSGAQSSLIPQRLTLDIKNVAHLNAAGKTAIASGVSKAEMDCFDQELRSGFQHPDAPAFILLFAQWHGRNGKREFYAWLEQSGGDPIGMTTWNSNDCFAIVFLPWARLPSNPWHSPATWADDRREYLSIPPTSNHPAAKPAFFIGFRTITPLGNMNCPDLVTGPVATDLSKLWRTSDSGGLRGRLPRYTFKPL